MQYRFEKKTNKLFVCIFILSEIAVLRYEIVPSELLPSKAAVFVGSFFMFKCFD